MKFSPGVEAFGQTIGLRHMHRIRWMLMKASLIYVLIAVSGMLAYAHTSSGQILDQRVSVGMDNEPLNVLFQRLEHQTGLSFAFSIDDPKTITFPIADRTLKETLDLALEDTSYTYEVIHNAIVIVQSNKNDKENDIPENALGRKIPQFTITGRVIDAITQQSLPGVNVVIKGTTRGTSTDNDGTYTLGVENGETLIFTFIGYKTVTTDVGNRSTIDVALEQDVAQLKEVVVNGGYYETTDKMKTGSIVKVTSKEIENQSVTSPLIALQGRVPGLVITPSSGAPGVAPTIRIRGTNSLRQANKNGMGIRDDGNYPLYVIDGIPISSVPVSSWTASYTGGGYDPLSTIDPNSIESIEVLKDGDATAIYGSRGANGVILITTKKNSKPVERTNVDISSYFGLGQVSRHLDMLNTRQYIAMRKEALSNIHAAPNEIEYDQDLIFWDTTKYTDWQKVLIGGVSRISDIQSTVSSGSKNTSFRLGGSYHKETLVFPGDFAFNRMSGQLSINHISENKKLKLSASSIYGYTKSHFFTDQGRYMSSALSLAPNAPEIYNADGSLNWELHDFGGRIGASTWDNPFGYLKRTQNSTTYSNIANVNASYEFLPSLLLTINSGYTYLANQENSITPRSSFSPNTNVQGSGWFNASKRTSWIIEPKLSYSRKLAEHHNLTVVAGATWQKNLSNTNQTLADNYASDAMLGSLKGAQTVTTVEDQLTEYKYASAYARLGYNWREKYLLNLTGRRDGSSRFGPGKRFGNFGAVGAAWVISEEAFFRRLRSLMNFVKLRGSYGITGSDNIGDYSYYDLYNILDGSYGGIRPIAPYALYNPSFAWEVTKKIEGALELGLADNRLSIELNWYLNRSSNQLVNYPLSGVTGFNSVISNFNATVQNMGWEGVVRVDFIDRSNFRWTASINLSVPRNVLLKFANIDESPYATQYKVGQPLSVQPMYSWRGVNNQTGLYDIEDRTGDGLLNIDDRTLIDPVGKIYYGGINNTLHYKALDISFQLQFSSRKGPRFMPDIPGRIAVNQPTYVLSRWRENGDKTDVQKYSIGADADSYNRFYYTQQSDHNIVDASFARLKNLSITYRLPRAWVEKAKLSETKFFLQAQNLFTITRYQGLDPETGFGLPPLLMVTLGIQMKL
jgi:TonB-linked SusC/RagA family outer membrane protein